MKSLMRNMMMVFAVSIVGKKPTVKNLRKLFSRI
jgi:hypothetical protein